MSLYAAWHYHEHLYKNPDGVKYSEIAKKDPNKIYDVITNLVDEGLNPEQIVVKLFKNIIDPSDPRIVEIAMELNGQIKSLGTPPPKGVQHTDLSHASTIYTFYVRYLELTCV